ncbi:MAG: hypothetical protein GY928_25275 [Colwellia sp.]|nr:hypothetical protein [Colwellia sp.]
MVIYKVRYISFLFLFSILSLLSGCTEEKESGPTESEVTIEFFNAVYNQKDLNKALSLSSEDFKKEIKKYKTINNFSRRVLNLSFDSVTIETQKSNTKVIDEFNIQVVITVMLTGQHNNKTYKEIKKLQLIRKNNVWLIDKLLKS